MFKQDQEIFNILLETVSDGVIIVDNHQKIMEVNASAETIFGYSKSEIMSRELNLLIPSNYHTDHSVYFEKFIQNAKNAGIRNVTGNIQAHQPHVMLLDKFQNIAVQRKIETPVGIPVRFS